MLDFQKIKSEHPIEQVAERLGLELKKIGNQYRGKCPTGEGDARALVITPAKGAWYSFSAQKGGDVISLVALVNNCSPKDAATWLTGDTKPEKKKREEPVKEDVQPKERGFRELDYLQHDHPAVIALGFDPDVAKRLHIGYAPRGVMKGLVALPVRDSNGQCVGYVGISECRLPPSFHLD